MTTSDKKMAVLGTLVAIGLFPLCVAGVIGGGVLIALPIHQDAPWWAATIAGCFGLGVALFCIGAYVHHVLDTVNDWRKVQKETFPTSRNNVREWQELIKKK